MSSPDFEDGGDLLDLDEALSIRQRWRQERQNRPRPDTLDALKGDRDRTRRQIAGRVRSPYHERPIIRVDHPKLPPLGEFFREHARRIDGHDPSLLTLSYLVREALYSPGNFVLPIEWGPKKAKLFRFIPGHTWDHETIGPTPSDVFVLGKMPGRDEVAFRRSFIGPSGEYLAELLQKILPTEYPLGKWYVTNILKHGHPDPGSDKNVPPAMIANCRHLLFQELAIVKPKYILCVGADAAKALFGNSATINRMEGQVLDYALPNGAKAQAMVTVHPAQVLREPHRETQIETTLYRYSRLVQGLSVFEDESERDYRTIQTQADLLDWITEVRQELAEADDPILAVDAEWHGEHPQNKGAYLRTLQVAWGVGKAACIVLRHQGGKYAFDISQKRLFAILKKKLFGRKTRICGHFLNSDLEMLTYYGLDLRENFVAPGKAKGKLPAWQRTRREGGFDTAIAMHNIEETARLKLELVALRYTNMRRWDGDLRKWVEDFCRENDLKSDDLEGFGECPGSVLIPYSLNDVDATYRLYQVMQKLLDKDHFGLNCRKSFWLDMRATPGVYEINTTGLLVDRERLDRQYDAFSARFKQLEKKLQRLFAWEETAPGRGDGLNINSVYHVREILYGTRLNGKKDDAGDPIRIRPEGAKTLKLTPLFDTAKRPTPWEKIVEEGREEKAAPSTGKTVLSILYAEATNPKIQDAIGLLRDCRYLNQAMRFTLRPPLRDKQDRILVDAAGRYQYGSGFGSFICDDERIRTHMLQAAETGRWRSARPPMQNWGKAREEDYQRILAELYTKPLRSVFKASPGHAFVEFDFKGAELFVTAIMSGDPTMIDHVYRNKLDEDDPNYIDIHSEIAVRAFRLNCAPTKAGLESIGRPKLRIAAKATIFGCLYGRQAKAIAIGCREQGAAVTLRDAQALIDSIFAMYPRLPDFFRACQDRAINERWIRNCAGRLRRFPWSGDFSVQGDMQRQAMNFPIQSAVADVVNVCVDRLRQYRRMSGSDLFRIALQIHDAILLEVPVQHVDEVVNRVVPICAERVPILPCNLSGQPLAGAQLHYLKSDVEVGEYWGEKLTIEACQRLGIHPKYAPPPKEKKPITVSA